MIKGVKPMKLLKLFTLLCCLVSIQIGDAVESEKVENNESTKYPQEHWYNLSMQGQKIGYMRLYLEKAEYQGEEMLRSKTDMMMQLKGLGRIMKIETNRVEYLDADLKPRYFVSTSNEIGLKQTEGKIKDGVVYITTTLNETTTESEIQIPADTISDTVAIENLMSKKDLKIGENLKYTTFSFDLLQPIKAEMSVIDEVPYTYQTEEIPVYVLEQKLEFMGGITTRMWVSDDGTLYKTSTDMMGQSYVASKTDRETALGAVEVVDIVLKTRIVPTGNRPKRGAKQFVANVQLTKGELQKAILTDSRQKLELDSERVGTLTIKIVDVDEANCPKLPIQDKELQEFLSETVYIESEHPDIHAKAVEILDGESNSWRAAKKLSNWVYKSVKEKSLSGGYSSALSTLKTGAGDCTEHTVLMIAMARSVGIPARICSGIVFMRNAFYYHFWPEVYVGTWVQMDPTIGQIVADANHIQLAGKVLESNTMIEYTEGVFRTLNQLEIAVVESDK